MNFFKKICLILLAATVLTTTIPVNAFWGRSGKSSDEAAKFFAVCGVTALVVSFVSFGVGYVCGFNKGKQRGLQSGQNYERRHQDALDELNKTHDNSLNDFIDQRSSLPGYRICNSCGHVEQKFRAEN